MHQWIRIIVHVIMDHEVRDIDIDWVAPAKIEKTANKSFREANVILIIVKNVFEMRSQTALFTSWRYTVIESECISPMPGVRFRRMHREKLSKISELTAYLAPNGTEVELADRELVQYTQKEKVPSKQEERKNTHKM